MRRFVLAVAVASLLAPSALAQQTHSIGPDRQDRWSVCIQPGCLDVTWVARIGATIIANRSGVFYAYVTCRDRESGDDYSIASGVGNGTSSSPGR